MSFQQKFKNKIFKCPSKGPSELNDTIRNPIIKNTLHRLKKSDKLTASYY